MNKSEATKFVKSQKSLHLYKNIQKAFIVVLCNLSDEEFKKVTNNLIVMAIHKFGGQVMHFSSKPRKFKVMQLNIPNDTPDNILNWIIAHELGHVMQDRNSKKSDGIKLEIDATERAKKWGFPETPDISKWLRANP